MSRNPIMYVVGCHIPSETIDQLKRMDYGVIEATTRAEWMHNDLRVLGMICDPVEDHTVRSEHGCEYTYTEFQTKLIALFADDCWISCLGTDDSCDPGSLMNPIENCMRYCAHKWVQGVQYDLFLECGTFQIKRIKLSEFLTRLHIEKCDVL